MKMGAILMRSNLQVQQPQTSMKVLDCRLVQGLELLSFPIIIRRHRVSRTSNTLTTVHCLLSVLQSRNSYWPGGSSMRYFIFYSYVQLYINVNSLQRVTRIHNHNSHDKIVKLGLPQPWLRAICKKYEDWDPAVCLKKSQKYNSGVVLIINPFRIRVVVQLQKFGHRDQECRKLQQNLISKIFLSSPKLF